jgi:hypothetical protein
MTEHLKFDIFYSHQGSQHNKKLTVEQMENYVNQYPDKFAADNMILLHREVKDNVVSNYFQTIYRVGFSFEFSDFIRDPVHGVEKLIRFNLFWKNFNRCAKNTIIAYEDFHTAPAQALQKIADHFSLTSSEQEIEQSIKFAAFAEMQSREKNQVGWQYYYKYTKLNNPESFKCRKGKVGGYINYMSPEDIEYCDSLIKKYDYIARMNA